ncbi:MAG: sporulation transcriptional regulator SpoIIID [Bacilli bacterium]|nr:sporulation transcriptional regulator SpoIIID [Bacilli bacterium]
MNEKIINEVKFYLNNSYSVKEAAEKIGISHRSFQIHIKKLETIDPFLHQMVLEKQKSNMIAGRRMGGLKSKRCVSYTKDKAIEIAKYMIENHLTYRECEEYFQIPSSTLSDMMHSTYIPEELKEQLDLIAIENKKSSTIRGKL